MLLVGLSAATISNVRGDEDTTDLIFGIYTNDKPSVLIRQFKPIIMELEKQMEVILGHAVEIDIKITKTYDDAVKFLVNGQFDFVRFGPASYVLAKDTNPTIDLIAMELVDGKKTFSGIIAIHDESEIDTIDDLVGTRFAFGNEMSTIGHYLAQQHLRNNDITDISFEGYEYLDRHDLVGIAVANKEFDAGALKENTFDKLVANGHNIIELSRFDNVTKPWVASSFVNPTIFNAIQQGLVNIDSERILSPLKISGFAEGTDEEYDIIRDSIDNNILFFKD